MGKEHEKSLSGTEWREIGHGPVISTIIFCKTKGVPSTFIAVLAIWIVHHGAFQSTSADIF